MIQSTKSLINHRILVNSLVLVPVSTQGYELVTDIVDGRPLV